jgi:hypothetical protein
LTQRSIRPAPSSTRLPSFGSCAIRRELHDV